MTLVMDVYFVGLMDDEQLLISFSLGILVNSVLFKVVAMSFISGLDTLISQAAGKGDKRMCKIYMSREMILSFYLMIPLSFLLLFMKSIFTGLLNQDELTAVQATEFCLLSFPGSLFFFYAMCYTKYIQF